MEQPTLCMLFSPRDNHPALQQHLGVFSGAEMTANILLPPLSLFINFIFYVYYYFTLTQDKREKIQPWP